MRSSIFGTSERRETDLSGHPSEWDLMDNQNLDDSPSESMEVVRAGQSIGLLNFFIEDIVTSVQVTWNVEKVYGTGQSASCVRRMCFSHLFMTLYKWTEFYRKFHQIIPDDCRRDSKTILKEIESRKIKSFRDRFIGHIWDRDEDRPLTENEILSCVETITRGDEESFLLWCNDPSDNSSVTFVSVIERVRDRISEKYDV